MLHDDQNTDNKEGRNLTLLGKGWRKNSCNHHERDERESRNKVNFRRMYEELLNKGNLSLIDELASIDFVNHEAPQGYNLGPKSVYGVVSMLRSAFPDVHFEINELIVEDDIVASRLTVTGAHRGPLQGIAPTNKSVRFDSMHFVEFDEKGKAREHTTVRDDLGLMKQLGVIP